MEPARQTTCELCGFVGPARTKFPQHDIVQCPQCDLIYYGGSAAAAEVLYDRPYFNGGEYLDYAGDRDIWRRNFKSRVEWLRRWKGSGRLLEIGCAYGLFLELAQTIWQASGLDISADGVAHARKLGVHAECADFLTRADEPASRDLICLWDTIEHLPHPVRCIEKAAKWLKPNGLLILTTGDIESLLARLQGVHWRQIHPPTHLFYFSQATLRRAIEQAGLRLQHVSYLGQYRGWRSMCYGLFALRHPSLKWLYRLLTVNGRWNVPIYLNLRDIIFVAAQKMPAPTPD